MVTVILLLGFGYGCGRTELDPLHHTQASPGLGGSSQNSSPISTGGSSGAGGMDTSTTTGGSSTGGSKRPSPDAGGGSTARAGCRTAPEPVCVPGPPKATRLTAHDEAWRITQLASSGEDLFVASTFSQDISWRGRLTRISLGSMAIDTLETKGSIEGLHYQAQSVLYRPAFFNPSDPLNYSPALVLWDLQTGKESTLPNPNGIDSASAYALTSNSKGEIFWGPSEGYAGPSQGKIGIAKWDPCTQKTEHLLKDREVLVLLAEESTIYWQEVTSRKERYLRIRLYSMPTTGGTPSLLLEVSRSNWLEPVLLAMDAERLYYRDSDLGVMSMTKQGGDRKTVLRWATPLWLDSSTIDGSNIYWVDADSPGDLLRTPKQGGNSDTLWTAQGRSIQALTVDACNVYWVVSNPQEIYYRGK
jgi:hypothetical protein